MNREKYFGKNVLILGLGKSGLATAKLLHSLGVNIVINDSKSIENVQRSDVKLLQDLNIKVILGHHPANIVDRSCDFIVKNPGIPYSIQPIIEAQKLGVPVITEIELAASLVPGEYIGITGSNGKTTTTALTGEILKRAGLQPLVGGNIGTPLSELALTQYNQLLINPTVLELSSFQLEGTVEFRPHIAAIINLYETHLDYHHTMGNYVEAKSKIFANQKNTDFLVLNADQNVLESYYSEIQSEIIWCSRLKSKQNGLTVDNNELIYRTDLKKEPICCIKDILIPGDHNIENALFASAIAILKGVSTEVISKSIMEFKGVEHRLELVGLVNDVAYYNDSKATNQQATIRALQSFQNPVILIAGGLDRGNEFNELIESFHKKVKKLLVYGQTSAKFIEAGKKAGISKIVNVNNLEEAVIEAKMLAEPNDVVLLSPACASWDMFTSFEERGQLFKSYVLGK